MNLNGSCFHFSGSREVNWWRAGEACATLNGTLLAPSDHQENEVIKSYLRTLPHHHDTFLGAYDNGHEGTWYWEATKKPLTFYNWAFRQPNNHTQHCLAFSFRDDYRWSNVHCDQAHAFGCKWKGRTHLERLVDDENEWKARRFGLKCKMLGVKFTFDKEPNEAEENALSRNM